MYIDSKHFKAVEWYNKIWFWLILTRLQDTRPRWGRWLRGWMTTGQLTRRDTLSKLVLYPNGRVIQISLPSTPKGPLGHVGHSKRDMTCASNLNLFDLVPSQIPHVIAKHNMRFSTKVQAVVGTSQKLPEAGWQTAGGSWNAQGFVGSRNSRNEHHRHHQTTVIKPCCQLL